MLPIIEILTMRYIFPAQLEDDPDGGFLVTFPDVPEAITHGLDRPTALAYASEALGLALRGYLVRGDALPTPQAADGVPVEVDPQDALKLAVVEAFNASGLSKSELARRLGRSEGEARRILDPDHASKLDMLQAALAVFGKRIIVEVAEAA